ncbi:MAG: hypothetical protein CSA81_07645 [Acidobacteria bacterium]|nr:MAG: hypothetical protein CSA81_07645 [Acidobacteriota bacterium]
MTALISFFLMSSFFQQEVDSLDQLIRKTTQKSKAKESIVFLADVGIEKLPPKLASSIKSFWEAYIAGQFVSCYQMHSSSYRNLKTVQTYVDKEKMVVSSVEIKKVTVLGDKNCAVVKLVYCGSSGQFDNLKINMRQKWFIEDGVWKLYVNPYEKVDGMGFAPRNKEKDSYPPFPCEEKKTEKAGMH